MAKNQLVMAVSAAFFVGLGCGYMLFSDTEQQLTATTPNSLAAQAGLLPAPAPVIQQGQSEMISKADISAEEPVQEDLFLDEPPTGEAASTEPENASKIPEEAEQLEQQLAQARQEIKMLQRALKGPEKMESQLQELFAQEVRDESWAYLTETQTSDFVYSEGFGDKIALDKVQCKSTVCRIEFSVLDGAEHDPRTDWRQIQSRLDKQPWWRQFQRTSAVSSDGSLSFWVERKPPES
ncbi:hypothetical protein [Pseudoalteromonas sp. T1lg88]|uniref:hypothetical protein n=1 Tax=Pseudoalteromonas sp. T1lg88 TaxID=2077104 RepID=UPI000CF5E10E|nr:hypothetical protein [Pseudoalteromonas sp. T1lg88]